MFPVFFSLRKSEACLNSDFCTVFGTYYSDNHLNIHYRKFFREPFWFWFSVQTSKVEINVGKVLQCTIINIRAFLFGRILNGKKGWGGGVKPLEKVGKCKYNQIVTIFKRKTFASNYTQKMCAIKRRCFRSCFFYKNHQKFYKHWNIIERFNLVAEYTSKSIKWEYLRLHSMHR